MSCGLTTRTRVSAFRVASRLVAVSPYDVLGERRQPNLPGTIDEYPNWRLPIPVDREELFTDRRVVRLGRAMSAARPPDHAEGS